MGSTYIIDLSTLQQINEDTGTTRSIRRTVLEPPNKSGSTKEVVEPEDERGVALKGDLALGSSFVQALFGVLYEVFNSMVRERERERARERGYSLFNAHHRVDQLFASSASRLF